MTSTPIRSSVIDGDGHIFEDRDAIARLMPAAYRERRGTGGRLFPPIDHFHSSTLDKVPPGSFQDPGPEGWVQFLEDLGMEGAVLYPSHALAYGNIVDRDWAIDLARAYNDWLSSTYMKRDSRFIGVGLIPMQDSEAAVLELRRVVQELGMCGAMLPSTGLKGVLGSKEYWPIYEEANRLGCCLAVHGGGHGGLGFDDLNVFAAIHALGHPFGILISFASMLFNGIFDRFPNVKIGYLESGVAWFLMALERFTTSYHAFTPHNPRGDLLRLAEGETVADYVIRQVKADRIFIGIEGDEPELAYAVQVVGNKPFLYSSDFPHEVTTASCQEEIQKVLDNEALTQADKEAILYKNAQRFYNLVPVSV